MPTTVTFETATLADVVNKAARVAPSKSGNAFDKAAGLLMEVRPDEEVKCIIRSTNLDVFYIEVCDCLGAEGEPANWRMPSSLLMSAISHLPTGQGKQVEISDNENPRRVNLSSGRMRASMGKMDETTYAEFQPINDITYTSVVGAAGRINQVAWAAAKTGSEPLNGIHFTGEHVVATDRQRMARAPFLVEIPRQVTVPVSIIGQILKQSADVEVGLDQHQIVFRPDDYTQISSVVFALDYPSAALDRAMRTEYDTMCKVRKEQLLKMISACVGFAGADRDPSISLFLGKKELAVYLTNSDTGYLGDAIDAPDADHRRAELCFSPKYLTDALNATPGEIVTLGYDIDDKRAPFFVNGGSGFEAWVAPRKKTS